MTEPAADRGKEIRRGILERRAEKIVSGRFVVLGISGTLVVIAVIAAVVMRIVDDQNFPTFGLALWWAVETFTTVGYGDIVPTTDLGRIIGGTLMVVGIMFLSFLTATVTSALIRRDQLVRDASLQTTDQVDLSEVMDGIARLEQRLERLESRLDAAGD